MGQQFFPHLPFAGCARLNGADGPLDEGFQLGQGGLVHAGAPRMLPRMRTNCCHSVRPASSLPCRFALVVRILGNRRGARGNRPGGGDRQLPMKHSSHRPLMVATRGGTMVIHGWSSLLRAARVWADYRGPPAMWSVSPVIQPPGLIALTR